MSAAGYSGTTLAKKLGIRDGFKIRLINPPEYYFTLFTDLPPNIMLLNDTTTKKDCIHYFATKAKELQTDILSLKREIKEDGIIWISWYKKASRLPTDITENFIRELALANGLVDIKVCAVDEIWSGLKMVIPVKDRLRYIDRSNER